MSKILSEEIKRGNLTNKGKKIVDRNEKYEIRMSHYTLGSQSRQRTDGFVLKFIGEKDETSDETMKQLGKVIKSMKKARRIEIQCEDCGLLTDESLKTLSKDLERLTCLEFLVLEFIGCNITNEGLSFLSISLKRMTSLRSINLDFFG